MTILGVKKTKRLKPGTRRKDYVFRLSQAMRRALLNTIGPKNDVLCAMPKTCQYLARHRMLDQQTNQIGHLTPLGKALKHLIENQLQVDEINSDWISLPIGNPEDFPSGTVCLIPLSKAQHPDVEMLREFQYNAIVQMKSSE